MPPESFSVALVRRDASGTPVSPEAPTLTAEGAEVRAGPPQPPLSTFLVNVTGSFLLALVAVVIFESLPPGHDNWYLLLGTGFCGGYTTFSTLEWETFKLVRDGSWPLALLNVLGSCVAGFVAVLLGVAVASLLFSRR